MAEYGHGGDWAAAQRVYGGAVLDFSVNLNPLGMPEPVRLAAARAAGEAGRYPDPLCRDLRRGIAARDGVTPGQVVCGNGAADLIVRLALALRPGRALVCAPTFSEYEGALGLAGCRAERHYLPAENGFALTGAILERIGPGLDLLFLCTPNNPTGRSIEPGLMEGILDRCARHGVRLAVDECFLELSDGAGPGLAPRLGEFPNLFLLRAFTKSYAIPGLRLGYGLSADGGLLERLRSCAQPWSVSGPAQAAGLAALECPEWPARARALVARERPALAAGLAGLGLAVVPGSANYLLFRAPGIRDLKERLLGRGILIRACGNFPGLEDDDYRVCVRTREENGRLLAAIKEAL